MPMRTGVMGERKRDRAGRRRGRCLLAGTLLALAWPALPARADVVVVTSARSSIEKLSRDEVINIFMGRYRRAPDGSAVHPLDLDAESPVRRAFYHRLLDKSLEEINVYWMRLVFAGRMVPPAETLGQDEMLEKLAGDPQAIGYVDRGFLSRGERSNPARVRVLLPLAD